MHSGAATWPTLALSRGCRLSLLFVSHSVTVCSEIHVVPEPTATRGLLARVPNASGRWTEREQGPRSHQMIKRSGPSSSSREGKCSRGVRGFRTRHHLGRVCCMFVGSVGWRRPRLLPAAGNESWENRRVRIMHLCVGDFWAPKTGPSDSVSRAFWTRLFSDWAAAAQTIPGSPEDFSWLPHACTGFG